MAVLGLGDGWVFMSIAWFEGLSATVIESPEILFVGWIEVAVGLIRPAQGRAAPSNAALIEGR
jgi:hypothetical protein